MDSSPPNPARHSLSHPSSPAHSERAPSEYSLDLAALTMDSASTPPSPRVDEARIDEVRSEDIDGPSDFTLHMEEWMRGTRKNQGKGTLGRGTQRSQFGTVKKESLKTMFSQMSEEQIAEKNEEEPSQQTPERKTGAPAGTQLVDSPAPDRSLSMDESEAEATPKVPATGEQAWTNNRHFLQPTVEDGSDLTPTRPLSAPPLPRPSPLAHVNNLDDSGLTAFQTDGDELSALRRELEEVRMAREKAELRAQHFEDQLRASNEAKKELQSQLDRTTDALRSADRDEARDDGQKTEKSKLEEQLSKSSADAEEARSELAKATSLVDELKMQLDEMRESEDAELHDLRWRVKSLAEGEKRIVSQTEDLGANLKKAQEEAERLRIELDSERRAKDHLQSQFNAQSQRPNAGDETAQLKLDLQRARDELELLRSQQSAQQSRTLEPSVAQAELSTARREIIELREELDLLQDLSRLDVEEPSIEVPGVGPATSDGTDNLKAQLDDALRRAAQFEKQVRDYALEMDGLRADSARAEDQKAALRRQVEQRGADGVSDAELRESERKRLRLHATLDEMRVELEGLRKANEVMDQKVAEGLRKREETWKARESEWLRERKTMVKALMRQWGREEMGVDHGEDQRFRYRFTTRQGKIVS